MHGFSDKDVDDFKLRSLIMNRLAYLTFALCIAFSISDVSATSLLGAFQYSGIGTNIPEPTTLALMGLGLAGIGYGQRSFKRQ